MMITAKTIKSDKDTKFTQVVKIVASKMNSCMENINKFGTGKSFSEALIPTSSNSQYDKRFFIESPVQ